jgi:hypothetical protein
MKNDGVLIELEGRSVRLRFSINTFCDLEDNTGLSLNEIFDRLKDSPRLSFIRQCYFVALAEADPTMTIKKAGDLIGELSLQKAAELLGQAMAAAFPTDDAKTPGGKSTGANPNPPQAGTGTSS